MVVVVVLGEFTEADFVDGLVLKYAVVVIILGVAVVTNAGVVGAYF